MPFNHPAEARRAPNSQAEYEADDNDPDLDPNPSDLDQTVRLAMLAIADALGDAEAYLADYPDHQPAALKRPLVAARVAQRLTAAGRPEEALDRYPHRGLGATGAGRRSPAIALDVCPVAPIEPASARLFQTPAGL